MKTTNQDAVPSGMQERFDAVMGILADNPLAWMITVDGIVMDARSAPREIQEEAFRLGLIPCLPGGDAGNPTADKMEE
ncbi:MAG: hypothetical protein HY922_04945 [Elusimicrobia bacterium]|nr:hypothetical protein [Elusimicrobiota bacterium]